MIRYNPRDWFGLIFRFHKADTFRRLLPVMISLAIYSGIIAYLEIEVFKMEYASTTTVHSLLGFILSLLLVFRTNTAYDRWWEGRKLWGALVNVSRNLSLKINAFIPKEHYDTRKRFQLLLKAYPKVLSEHLRNSSHLELGKLLPDFMDRKNSYRHVPNYLAGHIQSELSDLYQKGSLSEAAYLAMLNDLNEYTDICGACERIKKTPIPYTYNIFLKKFIFIYVITMPFGFVTDFGYWSIPITVFTLYTLASLELIAEEIEDPFGVDSNDLPTSMLAKTMGDNVKEIIKTQ